MPLAFKEAPFGLVGVEVDFANKLGKDLGKTIVFVETPFPELIQALVEERIDTRRATAMAITMWIAKVNSRCFALLSPRIRDSVRVLLEVRMDALAKKFHETQDMKVKDEIYRLRGN